ncbi:MAG: hypothetical protein KH319_08000 [Butyricicoccus pullicaecorum]|nr:hypothetical protein [Butyricicoccus pullicaecorum]
MKRNKWTRFGAAALSVTLLAPQCGLIAHAAAPAPTTDEAVYVNLDAYGALDDMRVVKGVTLNGAQAIADYGDYEAVYNMTSHDKPALRADGVDFTLENVTGSRFYYECIPSDPSSLQMPWTFDVSYKLDGVPMKAEDLAGASGLVEMQIHAIPNPAAGEYYRNNMTLILGTGANMDETKSLEAPGAQIQSMGSYKFAVFLGLPGEENTYTVRIGSDSFESMGIYMLMAPGTMSQLDTISDFRNVRDKLEGAHDDLYDGLSDMLDTLNGMQGGMQSIATGLDGINEVRRQLIASRGTIDPDIDAALQTLETLAGDTESLIPELDVAQNNLNAIHSAANEMLTTLTDSKTNITEYQKILKDLQHNLSNLEDFLDDVSDITGGDWLGLADMRKALKSMRGDSDELQDSLDDLNDALNNLNHIESVLRDLLELLRNIPGCEQAADALEALIGRLSDLSDACSDTGESLRSLLDGMNGVLKALENSLSELEDLGDVLDDYDGLAQDTAAIGQQAAKLAQQSLERLNTLLTQTEALTGALTAANTDANALIPKVKTAATSLTQGLRAANTLFSDTTNTLRSLRTQSDASTQEAISGLIDVMQRAADSDGTTESLQNATDSIHNTISDEVDSIDEDSNVLNMDNSLSLRSFTSEKNAAPSSLQFILRTSEISVDEIAEVQAEEQAEAETGVWDRIVNIFKKLFSAIAGVFAD